MMLVFVLSCIFFAASPLSACDWCTKTKSLPALTCIARNEHRARVIKHHVSHWQVQQALDTKISVGNVEQKVPGFMSVNRSHLTPPTSRFYTDYLSRYYPRVDAIVQHIVPTMCLRALQDVVEGLTFLMHPSMRHEYFVPTGTHFSLSLSHLWIFNDQIRRFLVSLESATIDPETGLIVVHTPGDIHYKKSVLHLLVTQKRQFMFDFLALSADYLISAAYVIIKFYDLPKSFSRARSLIRGLLEVNALLVGSCYERLYAEKATIYTHLLKMVYEKKGGRAV